MSQREVQAKNVDLIKADKGLKSTEDDALKNREILVEAARTFKDQAEKDLIKANKDAQNGPK